MLKSEKGLTLIEILASITIITVVLTTFFSFFIQNHIHTTINGEKFTATQLAQQKLAEVLQIPEKNILTHHCSVPQGRTFPHQTCYNFTEKIGRNSYDTYVFVQKEDSSGLYPVISRTFYRQN